MTTDSQQDNRSVSQQQIIRWRCPNCGQTLFTAVDDYPPDICDYCKDMTTWQRVIVSEHAGKNSS